MVTTLEFVDYDLDPEEIKGEWEISSGCLICYKDGRKSEKTVIPLCNIFRITETSENSKTDSRTWQE